MELERLAHEEPRLATDAVHSSPWLGRALTGVEQPVT